MLDAELYSRWAMRPRDDEQHSVRVRMLREAQLLRAAERQARREPPYRLPRCNAPAARTISCC
jgi:hypothetical protein